jgi:hypothetical protein
MTLGGCPIQWNSKLQTEIALSTTKAEYISLSQAMRELIPLRRLLLEIVVAMKLPGDTNSIIKSTVFKDNNGAILATATTVKMTPCTKHIAVKYYHLFKSHVNVETGISLSKIMRTCKRLTSSPKGCLLKRLERFKNYCADGNFVGDRVQSREGE